MIENGGVCLRKRFPEWRFLKTEVQRISVDVFENTYVTAHLHVPAGIAISVQACLVKRKYGRAKPGDENECFYPFSVV